ncbi:hypothetical protein FJ987_26140 [Mesorhizobium sp. CU2]|nr:MULTISPECIES: hypothetical protein [unclassified Mesorhizobium]TPN84830.1 hypothetical protein FJ988_09350 [Mesorhizobium sp. CU3]TPO05420.1 hypothetical protein FJ987_26140 [Mesorhizobium sp. CU2]
MVRRNKPKQLSGADLEKFLQASAGLHIAIVQPLISPQCDHYRSMRELHEALLRTVKDVTGKDAEFVRWFGGGSP